jgi:plastocyanin
MRQGGFLGRPGLFRGRIAGGDGKESEPGRRDRQWNCLGRCIPKCNLGTRKAYAQRVAGAGPAPDRRAALDRYLLGAMLLLALSTAAPADVTGTVMLSGKPNSQDETFVAQANGCGESPIRHTENWKVGPKGELGDVVVWMVDPKYGPPVVSAPASQPPPEIELAQRGCRYVPHVMAVQSGVNFKITNDDPTLHNIHAKSYDGPLKPPGADVPGFNFGELPHQSDERELDDPGIYTLQCDVHSWMQCWVMVLKSPCFGLTDADGKFVLRMSGDLEDGDYKLDAWHPRFVDMLEQTIHVRNGTAQVGFKFDGTKSL